MSNINNPQCSKQLEDDENCEENSKCYQIETLEEENSNVLTWAEWTPDMLKSKKSKELQITNRNTNEDVFPNSIVLGC
ncbi:hypothetical protein RF55_10859 [Lasius niger]|uniref:Uncharacterized protein n=1 Tax=Lasius niger TaxID=67767 RepID=A0A0J7KGG4_LASNI|nr:hypothetical protein RF55_10859 [Lasius niger]